MPVGQSWMWTLAFGYHEDRTSTHGYAETARGRDGGVRKKLAMGIGRVLINAQIAAAYALKYQYQRWRSRKVSAYGCPKKRY